MRSTGIGIRRHKIAVAAFITSIGLLGAADATAHSDFESKHGFGSDSIIFRPDSVIAGMTYGDWAAAWWQHVLTIPPDVNPLPDASGAFCAEGQSSGPVFFLVGSTGGEPVSRVCTVPAGKIIFFPIINAECSTNEGDGPTERELRFCAGKFADTFVPLEVTVDGKSIRNLEDFRAQSPSYTQLLPDPNIIDAEPGPGTGVADGYWIALKPLDPGPHTISFSGEAPPFDFAVSVTYELEVE